MNKWKKAYCIASVIFAVCVCVFTIAYSFAEPTVMYAAEAGDNDVLDKVAKTGWHVTKSEFVDAPVF